MGPSKVTIIFCPNREGAVSVCRAGAAPMVMSAGAMALFVVGCLALFADGSGSQPQAVDFARRHGRQGDFQEVLAVSC